MIQLSHRMDRIALAWSHWVDPANIKMAVQALRGSLQLPASSALKVMRLEPPVLRVTK